jgi:predicted MPP superfamily phosphohydrolase
MSRRRFFQMAAGLALSAGAVAGYTRLVEPHWLSIEKLELPIRNLPSALDGKRLVQLSDIHLCQYFSPDQLAGALAEVRRLAPDWLLLTGDFVGNTAKDAEGITGPLRTLTIPTFAIYGNHDLWSNRTVVGKSLRNANVRILVNEAVQLDSNLWLAGVDDLWSGDPDLRTAMNNIPPDAATILMAHEPDFFDIVLHEQAPVALQLSGHSHGGQVRLPSLRPDAGGNFSYAPILPEYGRRYPIGLRHVQGRYVYTNRGLGVWPIPYRWNCRPEITHITLRSA